jgi:hypothetical protein
MKVLPIGQFWHGEMTASVFAACGEERFNTAQMNLIV